MNDFIDTQSNAPLDEETKMPSKKKKFLINKYELAVGVIVSGLGMGLIVISESLAIHISNVLDIGYSYFPYLAIGIAFLVAISGYIGYYFFTKDSPRNLYSFHQIRALKLCASDIRTERQKGLMILNSLANVDINDKKSIIEAIEEVEQNTNCL